MTALCFRASRSERHDFRRRPVQPSANRVVLGAGATLLGGISIGDGSFVGAGAVVLEDVPARHFAVGVPAICQPIEKVDS